MECERAARRPPPDAFTHLLTEPLPRTTRTLRARNACALYLVREWLADDSGYDKEGFPGPQDRAEG